MTLMAPLNPRAEPLTPRGNGSRQRLILALLSLAQTGCASPPGAPRLPIHNIRAVSGALRF